MRGIEGGIRGVSHGSFVPSCITLLLRRSTKPPFLDNFAAATVFRIWSRLFSFAVAVKIPELRSQKYSARGIA